MQVEVGLRVRALVICLLQGQAAEILGKYRRPVRIRRAATPNARNRNRVGSAMRARPVNASCWVQAITSAPGNNTVALTDDAGYRAIQALHGVGPTLAAVPLNTTGRHG